MTSLSSPRRSAPSPRRSVLVSLLFAAAAPLGLASCGTPIGAYCAAYCDCFECSDGDRDDCLDDTQDAQKLAVAASCAGEFDAYATCASTTNECAQSADGSPLFEVTGCDAEARTLYDCAGDVGFGLSACEAAVQIFSEKYAECGVDLPPGTGEVPGCTDGQRAALACRAECVVDADCEALTGGEGSVLLASCVESC